MPATRSTQKDTGKAGAPKVPVKAASKAASRTTPRSKAKQATKSSTPSEPPASSSPAKTRSRAQKASAALTQHATSSDLASSSPAKTRSRKGKATNAPDQSKSSSGPPPSSPANTRSGKRKAAAALEQTASSPPVKTRRQSARVASRASTVEPVAVVPISEDVRKEKHDDGRSGPVSQTKGQDTDSSLSSIDSNVFDEETKNKAGDQKPEVKDEPMVGADSGPNTSKIITAASPSPNSASQRINDTTVVTDRAQKPQVVGAPDLTVDLEPKPSTTTTVARVPNLIPAVQANNNTTDTSDGSQKSHEEVETLKATKESGASLATTAEDTNGPTSSRKASSSAKATSSGGRKSRAKASTWKATTKSTVSKEASTSKKTLGPMSSPQVGSDVNAITVEDQMSHAKGTTSRVDSTTTTAVDASTQIPASVSTDDTMAGAQDPKSPPNDNSEPGTLKTSEIAANEPDHIQTVKDIGGAAVTEQSQAEILEAPGKDLHGHPTLAGREATCMSDSGANITPAPVPGNSPQQKDLPEPEVSTSAATPSPRLPLATSSISPLSGAVNPYPPITPNATSETGSKVLVENGHHRAQQTGSPSPPEELVLAGQSFKVLWPVYQDMRKLIELKDDQGKEVVDAERKLLWKLYEQCRELKSQLDEHERRKNEREEI